MPTASKPRKPAKPKITFSGKRLSDEGLKALAKILIHAAQKKKLPTPTLRSRFDE